MGTISFPRIIKLITFTVLAVVMLYAPGVSALGTEAPIPNAPAWGRDIPANLGCLVCHSDPKYKADKVLKSVFVEKDMMMKSSHKDIPCTGCHSNYTTAPTASHEEESKKSANTFIQTARTSCYRCKDHQKDVDKLRTSAHDPNANNVGKQPTCVDCHGYHDIRNPDRKTKWGKDFALTGKDMCGSCHTEAYDSYNDYYHGMPYKMKEYGTPACWDCHGNHDMHMINSPESQVNDKNLPKACKKCHKESSPSFVSYAPLIHSRASVIAKNPLWDTLIQIYDRVTGRKTAIEQMEEELYKELEG